MQRRTGVDWTPSGTGIETAIKENDDEGLDDPWIAAGGDGGADHGRGT